MEPGPDDALWQAIAAHRIGPDDASLSFEQRLARENGWSADYAGRVVLEYKKFCYLACTAGHQVTPSDQVDQAWHLHLTYTRDYWERFCPQVLHRPLHHGPTAGGPAEKARYFQQYAQTLAAYEQTFGALPPEDIWSPASERFGSHLSGVRVHTDHVVTLSRRTLWLALGGAIVLSLAIGLVMG